MGRWLWSEGPLKVELFFFCFCCQDVLLRGSWVGRLGQYSFWGVIFPSCIVLCCVTVSLMCLSQWLVGCHEVELGSRGVGKQGGELWLALVDSRRLWFSWFLFCSFLVFYSPRPRRG